MVSTMKLRRRQGDAVVDLPDVECTISQLERRLVKPYDLRRGSELAILRDGGLGDILLTTPVLREIKRRYPQLAIYYYTTQRPATMLTGNPNVAEVRLLQDFSDDAHPLSVDLRGYPERHPEGTTRARQDLFADAFGLSLSNHYLDLFLTPEELQWGRERIEQLPRPVIGVMPTSSTPSRDWPAAGKTLPLLKDRGSVVWFQADSAPEQVDLWVPRSEGERMRAAVVAALDVVITTDTGLMHMAAAVQHLTRPPRHPKILALFGVSSAELRLRGCSGPYAALRDNSLECSPCDHSRQRKGCGFKCTKHHTPERVTDFLDMLMVGYNGEDLSRLH